MNEDKIQKVLDLKKTVSSLESQIEHLQQEIKKLDSEMKDILSPIYKELEKKQDLNLRFKIGDVVSLTFSNQRILAEVEKFQKLDFLDWMLTPTEQNLFSYHLNVLYPMDKKIKHDVETVYYGDSDNCEWDYRYLNHSELQKTTHEKFFAQN